MEYIKNSESELKVIKEIEVAPTTEQVYDYDFLKNQEISILKSKNDFVQARDKELEEVRALIAKCEELGIRSKIELEAEQKAEELETKLEEQVALEEELNK